MALPTEPVPAIDDAYRRVLAAADRYAESAHDADSVRAILNGARLADKDAFAGRPCRGLHVGQTACEHLLQIGWRRGRQDGWDDHGRARGSIMGAARRMVIHDLWLYMVIVVVAALAAGVGLGVWLG